MNSKEKLAQALEEYKTHFFRTKEQRGHPPVERGEPEHILAVNKMIERAKEGYYSDYDSPLALPCIQLVTDLTALGLTALAVRAKNGEFDATKEESDAWYEREGKQIAMEAFHGNEEVVDALFGRSKEETESKEGIKGWDI